MINTISVTPMIFAGLALFFAFMMVGKFRLPALLRYYALSSFCVAAFSTALAFSSETSEGALEIWIVGVVTVLIKVFLVPWVILYAAKKSGAMNRLQSFTRQSMSYFIAVSMLLVSLFVVMRSQFASTPMMQAVLFVSVSFILMGLVMMMMRRDIFSQIVGFLLLENGITVFGIVAVGAIPVMIEFGFFAVIIMSAVIMTTLSRHVQELYGSEDTEQLRDLID